MSKKKYGITLKDLIDQKDRCIKARNEEEDREYKQDINSRIDRINDMISKGEYDK